MTSSILSPLIETLMNSLKQFLLGVFYQTCMKWNRWVHCHHHFEVSVSSIHHVICFICMVVQNDPSSISHILLCSHQSYNNTKMNHMKGISTKFLLHMVSYDYTKLSHNNWMNTAVLNVSQHYTNICHQYNLQFIVEFSPRAFTYSSDLVLETCIISLSTLLF